MILCGCAHRNPRVWAKIGDTRIFAKRNKKFKQNAQGKGDKEIPTAQWSTKARFVWEIYDDENIPVNTSRCGVLCNIAQCMPCENNAKWQHDSEALCPPWSKTLDDTLSRVSLSVVSRSYLICRNKLQHWNRAAHFEKSTHCHQHGWKGVLPNPCVILHSKYCQHQSTLSGVDSTWRKSLWSTCFRQHYDQLTSFWKSVLALETWLWNYWKSPKEYVFWKSARVCRKEGFEVLTTNSPLLWYHKRSIEFRRWDRPERQESCCLLRHSTPSSSVCSEYSQCHYTTSLPHQGVLVSVDIYNFMHII